MACPPKCSRVSVCIWNVRFSLPQQPRGDNGTKPVTVHLGIQCGSRVHGRYLVFPCYAFWNAGQESVSTVRSAQSGRSARSVPSARSARSTRSNQSTATTTATVSTVSPIGRLQVEARAQTYARQGQRLFGSTPIRGEQRTRPKASAEGATSQTPPPSFRARTSVSSSRKERSPTGKLRSPRTSSRATGGHS